ncbi:MAG: tetratricopeptide repeat protein [Sandaracinaceae bacterium]
MTKYLCVHCDKTFVHEGEKKPRCPSCMRVNGLETVAAPRSDAERQRPPWMMWAVAGGVIAAGAIAYAVWAGDAAETVEGDAPLAALDRSEVTGYLRARGVDAHQLNMLLVSTDPIEEWAEHAVGSASTPTAKAEAIQTAIRARASEGAFERWSFGIPRNTPPALPEQVLEWMQEDGAHHHLYPLEVAALMASALRAVDVPAIVAEAVKYEGERRPADPSGQLGYYVVAVYPGTPGEGEPTTYDPYEGREVAPSELRPLTDLEAIGAMLGHRALYLLSRESDPERAVEASSQALRLDGRSAANRAVRGAILLAAGQADEGLEELTSAKQLRSDGPRRNLLASVYLAQQDVEGASREVSAALEEYPEFASARATLAAIHLTRGETDEARAELQEAERIDPQLHLLPQLWAEYYASTGEIDRAVQRAQQAVEQNGDIQTRLMAARIYRQAARYDLMRREAHAVLERTPPRRESDMRELIRRMLGPTALEPIEDEAAPLADGDEGEWDDSDVGLGDPSSLSLDSPLLGTGGGGGPSLLGGGGGGPSLLGDDERLGGGGGGGLGLGGGGDLSLGGGGGGGGGDGLSLDLGQE